MPAAVPPRGLLIECGTTFKAALKLTQKVNKVKVPIDLTGYDARMQIRPSHKSATILLSLTVSNGGITIDEPNGIIRLRIEDSVTTGLTWTQGVFDLEIIQPNGDVLRLIQGAVRTSPEVTR
jgi:hypothetical protein